MKANRDLDALIADIIGQEHCHHELEDGGPKCKHCGCNRTHWEPKWGRISPPSFFSKDAAMAIWAGERAGVFKKYSLAQGANGKWRFLDDCFHLVAEEDTFPLVVCAAISNPLKVTI